MESALFSRRVCTIRSSNDAISPIPVRYLGNGHSTGELQCGGRSRRCDPFDVDRYGRAWSCSAHSGSFTIEERWTVFRSRSALPQSWVLSRLRLSHRRGPVASARPACVRQKAHHAQLSQPQRRSAEIARATSSGVAGATVRRAFVAWCTALRIAAAVGTSAGSPMPLAP